MSIKYEPKGAQERIHKNTIILKEISMRKGEALRVKLVFWPHACCNLKGLAGHENERKTDDQKAPRIIHDQVFGNPWVRNLGFLF